MSINQPSVSIVIPAYRVSEWVGETLDSVFRQTYSNYEVLVIDQDLNEAMGRTLKPFLGRIIHLPLHQPNVSAARNLAIQHARGRYIANLDGDDVWEPNALEVLMGMLESDSSLDAVTPNAIFFGEPKTEGALFQQLFPAFRPIAYEDVITRRSHIFSGTIYRKEAAERAGGYDTNIRFGEDLDLWIRMIRTGSKFDFTEKVLSRYRRRATAACNEPVINRLNDVIRVYDKQLEQPGLTPQQKRTVEKAKQAVTAEQSLARAKLLLSSRDFTGAREALDSANRYQRSAKLTAISMALRVAPSLVAAFAGKERSS